MAALEQMRRLAASPQGQSLGDVLKTLDAAVNRLDFNRAQAICRQWLAQASSTDKEMD
ncbi:hypothetical protein O0544_18695 [Edwardsiella anguillarum]|nr:hypothetical protein [Edwardsiella anguillarum]